MSPRVTFLDWEQLLPRGTQPHVTAGHSFTSNLAKCHKRVLKYNIKVFNVLFVTKDFKGHLEEAWGPQDAYYWSKGKCKIVDVFN